MGGNGALMNSGSKPIPHAPMLLQSSSSAAIFPYFKYFNPRKFISISFSKSFFKNKDFSTLVQSSRKMTPNSRRIASADCRLWALASVSQKNNLFFETFVYNIIVFINFGQMMMAGQAPLGPFTTCLK